MEKKIILQKILRLMAVVILKRHNPMIVAISGTVGKTLAKIAVLAVLSSKFTVGENKRRYNDKIGLPLSIIGVENDIGGFWGWIGVGWKWISVLILPNYPKILVLKLEIIEPKDMEYYMSMMRPYVGVVTNISSNSKEQKKLVESIPADGYAVLNADDEKVSDLAEKTSATVITIGSDEKYSVSASNISYNYEGEMPDGISFKLNYDGNNIPIRLRHMKTPYSVYTALIAAAIGIVFKMNLVEIGQALEDLKLPDYEKKA